MPILSGIPGKSAANALSARDAAMLDRTSGRDAYQPSIPAPSQVTAPKRERICGAPGCNSGWTMPWKRRNRPVFEQEWGCSARCLTALVRAAVRREVGDGAKADAAAPHRHRVPLGLVLLAQGWISHPQLQMALEAQRASGRGRIGDWLTQSCGLGEERIARGLGTQWNCPVLSLDDFSPSAMALVLPKRLIAEFGQVPVRVAGSSLLYLAFEERMDAALALGVEQMCGLRAESGLLPATQFAEARAKVLAADGVQVQMKLVSDRDALTAAMVRALEQQQPVASHLVRVHQYYWLRLWLEKGATRGIGRLPPSAEDVQDYLFLMGK